MVKEEKVYHSTVLCLLYSGGKAKPLKAAKKEKKELDEDDLAFKERQRAGTLSSLRVSHETAANEIRHTRGQGQEGSYGQG